MPTDIELAASTGLRLSLSIVVDPDDSGYHAYCPALKGCRTWGHTREEAMANIREAIDLYVQDLLEAGERIPVDQGTIELPEPAVVVNV